MPLKALGSGRSPGGPTITRAIKAIEAIRPETPAAESILRGPQRFLRTRAKSGGEPPETRGGDRVQNAAMRREALGLASFLPPPSPNPL